MGRKIPAKKHRGVKDPLIQHARRVESLKGKINAPPRDPDEQPIPKSLLRLFGAPAVERRRPRPVGGGRGGRLCGRGGKSGGTGGRGGGAGTDNPVARLQRLPGESPRAFSRRITGATRALHTAEDPHYYPQEEEDDEEEVPTRRRRRGEGGVQRESKAQRRKLKLQAKKQEAAESRLAEARAAVVYERVSFGEQAHAPPALPAPRLPRAHAAHAAHATATPRPGRRELLLSRMLNNSGEKSGAGSGPGAGVVAGVGAGERERRRAEAVAAYRALKKQQRLSAAAGRR